jgi:soluble lytic murein transglycosylase-like protein
VAEAQILIAQGAGAGLTRLVAFLEANPTAPQANQIARLARRAGATDLPQIAQSRQMVPVRLTPPIAPRSARGTSAADAEFSQRARSLLAADRSYEIEALLDRMGPELSAEVRSEWTYRAAWDAYLDLNDMSARRLGKRAADGSGEWASMGNWVAGLASFRQNDCEAAAVHFDQIGKQFAAATDTRSAAAYWAARSHIRCSRPEQASERLKAAMARDRTGFYGLLAARTLGVEPNLDWREPDFIQADWTTLKPEAGARRAAALVEIGQLGLADRELRHLAATTRSELYEPILRLAARLNLPATQYWLAQNPPSGMMPPMSAQLPTPDWRPFKGWRVDRNLVYAHALQESKFITTARSGVGAKGLMQIMPGTARDLSKALEMTHRDDLLADPAFNVEYGQSYLEMLRDSPHTGGLLPKVIAAYNAGPGSVQKWNAGGVKDNGDVLLFIESIPFRETRHYVEVVMRNYWLYELKDKAEKPAPIPGNGASLAAVAQNQWPKFPARTAPPAPR